MWTHRSFSSTAPVSPSVGCSTTHWSQINLMTAQPDDGEGGQPSHRDRPLRSGPSVNPHSFGIRASELRCSVRTSATDTGSARRDADPTPLVGWAGWDHLQSAQALAAIYEQRRSVDGWAPERFTPIAGLGELVTWLRQWHTTTTRPRGCASGTSSPTSSPPSRRPTTSAPRSGGMAPAGKDRRPVAASPPRRSQQPMSRGTDPTLSASIASSSTRRTSWLH